MNKYVYFFMFIVTFNMFSQELEIDRGTLVGPENIVEIYIPTGSPNRHSYFYDYRYNLLSSSISFPIYYDIVNDNIVAIGEGGLNLLGLKIPSNS